jgi:CDP-diacylglycerol--serine O-phosphatidyltransferase
MKRVIPIQREDSRENGAPAQHGPKFRKAIFLLPNLFTASNLILGFLSIVMAFNDALALKLGQETQQLPFVWSARLILIAILFDMMDGRLARATGTTSRFGVEFDSMSDLVSFGMAPAVLIYATVLRYLPLWIGVFPAVLYVVCAAVRLARFNVQSGVEEKDKFMGLPSPAAAGVLASYVLLSRWPGWGDHGLMTTVMNFYENKVNAIETVGVPILTFLVAFLMVSTVRYPAMKKLNWEKVKAPTLVAVILILYFVFTAAEFTVFALLLTYLLWGLLGSVAKGGLGRLRQGRIPRTPPTQ